MGRKNIEVDLIKEWVNGRLAIKDASHRMPEGMSPEQAFRLGQASLMEQILHYTGNYNGFNYNVAPGERYVEGVTDETRRHYY